MIYRGHIENGLVVFDEPVALPNGVQVSIHLPQDSNQPGQPAGARAYFGSISSGDPRSADNTRLDRDLGRDDEADA